MDGRGSAKNTYSKTKDLSRIWTRNQPDAQHNIRFLPSHIIERICQFLIDDQPIKLDGRLCAKWISEGVVNVLQFRSTCRHFNQLVKGAFLDFSLFFDGRYLKYFDDMGTRNIELFLKLIKTDFNWRCSYLLINVLSIEKRWELIQRILKILLIRKSIFGKGLRTLKIGKFADFSARYADLILRLAPILSQATNIYVKFEADSFLRGFVNSRMSDLSGESITDLKNLIQVKGLNLYTSQLMEQQGARLAMEETREIFKNVEDFSYSDSANFMPWRPILPCQFKKLAASRVNGNELEDICNRTKTPQFPHLEKLEMTVLHYENSNSSTVPFFTHFTALSYLDLFTVSNLDESIMIILPNSCRTLKILLSLLKRFQNCHSIENLCLKHEDYAEPQLNEWIEGK